MINYIKRKMSFSNVTLEKDPVLKSLNCLLDMTVEHVKMAEYVMNRTMKSPGFLQRIEPNKS